MKSRFYSANPIETPNAATAVTAKLAESEAHHLLHVLRARIGDTVTLFDGTGREFTAQITAHTRNTVELDVLDCQVVDRESPVKLTLAVSLPKGDRQKLLVEKCVELGVSRLVPLATQRSVAQPTSAAIGRLRRAVIEASKQCGRNRLLQIVEPQPVGDLLVTETTTDELRLVAHPCAEQSIGELSDTTPSQITAVVGPEGGLTDAEINRATEHRWTAIHLGPRILRTETAALAIAAQLVLRATSLARPTPGQPNGT